MRHPSHSESAAAGPRAPGAFTRDECRNPGWLIFALGGLILVCYANSFHAGLTMDNISLIAEDSRIRALDSLNLKLIFTKNYWWPVAGELYRPLTTLSYLFNYAILGNGANVTGYHVVNYFLHWANACLVLVIVRRLSGRIAVAALAAALFAVHPVNTEAVTNIVGRADLLATLSVLFGGWCHLRAAEADGGSKCCWLAGLGGSAILGVLCKENAVMICAFVVLYDWLWRWPRLAGKDRPERSLAAAKEFVLRGYVALAPALILVGLAHRWLVANSPLAAQVYTDNPIAGTAPFQGFMTACGVIGRGLGLLVFPWKLSNDYSYHQIPVYGETGNAAGDVLAWCSIALITVLLVAALLQRKRQPLFAWGVLFFFIMQLPTANLLFPIGSIMAERFLYLPSIGFCVLAALAFCRLGAAFSRAGPASGNAAARWALPALAIVALGARTYARNKDWQDEISLWKSAVENSPASLKAHQGYASALLNAGQGAEPALDAAIQEAEIGVAIFDQGHLPIEDASGKIFYDLGLYYRLKGEFLEKHDPPDQTAAAGYGQKSVAILQRARAVDQHLNKISHEAMIARGRPAAEIPDVGNFLIYVQLGLAEEDLENWTEGEAAGRYALHLAPEELKGYLIVGAALYNSGRTNDAAVQYLAALLLDPMNNEALVDLARCYVALRTQPLPLLQTPLGYQLDFNAPIVRQELNEAAPAVVRLFDEAQRSDEARQLQARFIKQYSIPPEFFSTK